MTSPTQKGSKFLELCKKLGSEEIFHCEFCGRCVMVGICCNKRLEQMEEQSKEESLNKGKNGNL